MSTNVQSPAPVSYANQMADTLKAQLQAETGTGDFASIGPRSAIEAQYQPIYQQQAIDMAKAAVPQVLDIYNSAQPALAKAAATNNTAQRTADIGDLNALGPQVLAAQRNANPGAAGLVDKLTSNAQAGLDAGGQLTPEQQRTISQSSAFSDRGLGGSPTAAIDEIVRGQMASQGLQGMRQQQASGAIGANQAFYGDMSQQILGRPSGSFGMTQGALGQANGYNQGNVFNPESALSAQITGQNQQMAYNTAAANAAGANAITGAAIGAAGSVGSSM